MADLQLPVAFELVLKSYDTAHRIEMASPGGRGGSRGYSVWKTDGSLTFLANFRPVVGSHRAVRSHDLFRCWGSAGARQLLRDLGSAWSPNQSTI